MRPLPLAFCALIAWTLTAGIRTDGITLEAAGKRAEIRDAAQVQAFRFGPGPGNTVCSTLSNCTPLTVDWIARWSAPAVQPDPSLTRYTVTFHLSVVTTGPDNGEPRQYVVIYVYSPSEKRGYVFLPGKGDDHYESNVRLLYRGPQWDGHWFVATDSCVAAAEAAIRNEGL